MNEVEKAQMQARLAAPAPKTALLNTTASMVFEFRHEISAARAAGKTFAMIAEDLSVLGPASPDAVRHAFNRNARKQPKRAAKSSSQRTVAPAPKVAPAAAPPQSDPILDDERAKFFAGLSPSTDTLSDLKD